jgi:hypothetical protein
VAIIIEFIGGFRDGTCASSESSDPTEADLALGIYYFSNSGEFGRIYKTYPDAGKEVVRIEGALAGMQKHVLMNEIYKVLSKTIGAADTIVRFEYLGQEE